MKRLAPLALLLASVPASAGKAKKLAKLDAAASAEIAAVPTGDGWDSGVEAVLMKHFDRDESGYIDTEKEIGSVGCLTWEAIDHGYQEYRGLSSFLVGYGFADDELIYMGYDLGFRERDKEDVTAAAVACGLTW